MSFKSQVPSSKLKVKNLPSNFGLATLDLQLKSFHSSLFSQHDFDERCGRAFARGEECVAVECVADGLALSAWPERDDGRLLTPDVVELLRAFGESQLVAARVVAER